jgi:hypothetical protein
VPWFYRLAGCHGSLNALFCIGTTSFAMDQVAMIAKDLLLLLKSFEFGVPGARVYRVFFQDCKP